MHEPGGVRGGEPGACREHDVADLAPFALAVFEPLAERDAFDVLHRDEHAIAGQRADVVHGDDVWMREPRECLGFTQQPRLPAARRALGRVGLQQA